MKKLLYISVILFTAAISSCTLESSDNGKLDGFWHLERIDTIPTGGVNDLSDETLFWAVENKILQLKGGSVIITLRFNNTSDSLILSDPYRSYGHEESGTGGDVQLTDPEVLKQYGVQHLEEHFVKESLKSSNMVLRTDSFRLYFKKF